MFKSRLSHSHLPNSHNPWAAAELFGDFVVLGVVGLDGAIAPFDDGGNLLTQGELGMEQKAGADVEADRLQGLAGANQGGGLPWPLVGRLGPTFEAIAVVDQAFERIRLVDYRGRYVILLFYPLDFTFVCPTEIGAFSDRYDEFQALETDILGISVDSHYAHLAWIQTERKLGGVGDVRYPLVSDLKREIVRAYQVLDPQEGVALRGLFILDPAGSVQHATINHLAFGRSVDETLRTLRAIQHVQRHRDQLCPVDWQPGGATLLASPSEP